MTFSDAEDDHQGAARNASNEADRSVSRSRTESGVSNASTASLASPSSSAGPPAAASNGPAAIAMDVVTVAQNATVPDMTGVDKKKILEKLQQIQGYIQQTTAAMAALEQQGDITNVGQYNTLAKVLRELKDSEAKLRVQAAQASQAAAQVANGSQQNTTANSSCSPVAQVNGREEPASTEEGSSRVVGMVGQENVRTLQDRLTASQEESVAIMTQMRASIARREDLMTRYKATQERLANLKKQRQGIHEEKQRLLQQGASSAPTPAEEEDPIPGAENWTLDEVTRALVDFQAMKDKVERLTSVYSVKAQGVPADDEEAQADVANKMGQLNSKHRQLTDVITRLKGYQLQKQQQERDAGEDDERGQPGGATPAETPVTNHTPASNHHPAAGEEAPPPPPPPAHVSNINGDTGTVTPASLRAAAASVSHASDELQTRKSQLESLQKQLSDMKKLLEVASVSHRQLQVEAGAGPLPSDPEAEGAVGGEVVEVSGRKIYLTEAERQNPEIAAKYSQLSKAKERLAKMEEVLAMISSARMSGQNLREVIPADHLAILEEAEEEFPESASANALPRRSVPQRTAQEAEEAGRLSRRPTRPPRMGSGNRSEAGLALGPDSEAREQESREISAMQQRLNKNNTRVSAVNEGSRHGNEKGAVKKQPQALWQGSSSSGVGGSGGGAGGSGGVSTGGVGGEDPRLAQVLAMQEELRQKKNALEALMRRMGKSSSLNMDNISDNISDNVSDTSERLGGEGRTTGGAATWGEAGGLHHFSDNHYQQSSDEDLVEEDEADLPLRGQRRSQQPPLHPVSPKDRNRHSTSRHRRRQDSGGRFSVNNLSTSALPTPTRTKHNRLRASSAPKALWESVSALEGANYKSPSNTAMQTQHSLNTALTQLNQVQGTINNLQESLRHEQSHVVLGGSSAPHYTPQLVPPLMPDLTPSSLPPVASQGQALTPMSAYTGLGSLALATQGGGDTVNQQLLAGLQQCFTQLHLHSLEIQALSKHLQVRRPLFYHPYLQYPQFPPYQ